MIIATCFPGAPFQGVARRAWGGIDFAGNGSYGPGRFAGAFEP
jgi:hypothetical protein